MEQPQAQRVSVSRRSAFFSANLEEDVRRARRLAEWLDARFKIGGIRFGFDSIIGLIPGVGDTLTAIIGIYPLLLAHHHRLGKWVQVRMAGNLLLDWLIGLIPLLGDLFDTAFKSHIRNVRLFDKAARKKRRPR